MTTPAVVVCTRKLCLEPACKVACKTCGAQPRQHCVTLTNGRPYSHKQPHAERWIAGIHHAA